jgi:hypothetical protein
MKKVCTIALATFLFSASFAQIENTRWKTSIRAPEPTNVIIDFKKDRVSVYTVSDSTTIETMTYTKTDHSFTLLKIDGQTDCDNSTAGKYNFNIKNDSSFFTLVKDECEDRASVLQNSRWAKWISYPGIKVDEAELKKYTGVYAHDAGHPITISVENGILYAEGPNNGLPKSPLTPITASKFFLRIAGVEMDFIKDPNGNISKLISHEEKDFELKKIK